MRAFVQNNVLRLLVVRSLVFAQFVAAFLIHPEGKSVSFRSKLLEIRPRVAKPHSMTADRYGANLTKDGFPIESRTKAMARTAEPVELNAGNTSASGVVRPPFYEKTWKAYVSSLLVLGSAAISVADYGCGTGKLLATAMEDIINIKKGHECKSKLRFILVDLVQNNWERVRQNCHAVKGLVESESSECSFLIKPGSFYESCGPQGSVDIAICDTCLHWLSEVPALPTTTYHSMRPFIEMGKTRWGEKIGGKLSFFSQLHCQSRRDAVKFLYNRGLELKEKGKLCLRIRVAPVDTHKDQSVVYYPLSREYHLTMNRAINEMNDEYFPNERQFKPLLPFWMRTTADWKECISEANTQLEKQRARLNIANWKSVADVTKDDLEKMLTKFRQTDPVSWLAEAKQNIKKNWQRDMYLAEAIIRDGFRDATLAEVSSKTGPNDNLMALLGAFGISISSVDHDSPELEDMVGHLLLDENSKKSLRSLKTRVMEHLEKTLVKETEEKYAARLKMLQKVGGWDHVVLEKMAV